MWCVSNWPPLFYLSSLNLNDLSLSHHAKSIIKFLYGPWLLSLTSMVGAMMCAFFGVMFLIKLFSFSSIVTVIKKWVSVPEVD